jgi:hypothetical protein
VLSEKQVDYILNDIRRNGIQTEELQFNLLDHICCVIENEMSPENDFDEMYRSVLPRFFKKELKEIQEETDLLLTFKNYYTMKKVMLRSGIFSAVAFTIGALFKIMHWPGASMLLVLAITSVSFVFLPIFFLVKTKEVKEKKEKFILGFGSFFGVLFSISIMFKIMHWPGANMLWLMGLGVLFFLFLPMYFFTGIRNPETKLNTILSSIMILIAGGLLFTITALYGTKEVENANKASYLHLKESVNSISVLNALKYETAVDSLKAKNEVLKKKTNILIGNIAKVRADLNKYISNGQAITEENLNAMKIGAGLSTMYLFDDNQKPKPYLSAIKSEIDALKNFIDSTYGIGKSKLLNTSDGVKVIENEEVKSIWEKIYFYQVPLEYIYRNFDQLILDIRITEANCIK